MTAVDPLNRVLQQAVFPLPDVSFVEENINITLTHFHCGNVTLAAVTADTTRPSHQQVEVDVRVTGISLTCAADWTYVWLTGSFVTGSGHVVAEGSALGDTAMGFTGEDFRRAPPTNTTTDACNANLTILDSVWTGGITAGIATLFKDLVDRKIEEAVSGVACSTLRCTHT
jgi:hypothetical protein